MSNINPSLNNRSRYSLSHNDSKPQEIDESEIEGWSEDGKEYARNKDYDGIFAKFSNNLKFYDSAKDYINGIRKSYGVNSRIRLIKEYLDQEDIWRPGYTGLLDLSTWSYEDGSVQVKFNSSSLEKLLRARQNDKVEIERLTDLQGHNIPPLELKDLELTGRKIFLDTRFNILPSSNKGRTQVESNAGNTRFQSVGIPLNLFYNSHDNTHSIIPESYGTRDQGTTGMMFFANNDRDRNLEIKINVALDAFFQQYEKVQWCTYQICLTTYKNGVDYEMKERRVIAELRSQDPASGSNSRKILPGSVNYTLNKFTIPMDGFWEGSVNLLENESLALECLLGADMYFNNNAGVRVYAQNIVADLRISEDSFFENSITKGVLAYELFDRTLRIITSRENIFKSSYFDRIERGAKQDGPGAYNFNSHGHWIRRFSEGEELYKRFTTSFKEAFDSYKALFNVGLGIESLGHGERIIIEDKKYFYSPQVTLRLGTLVDGEFIYDTVSKLKRRARPDLYFSAVEIGSEKAGNYSSIMGLEEVNTKSTFITCIEALENVYKEVAKYRFDPYGEEIIRRKGIESHPTTDFPEDLEIWVHDVKRNIMGSYDLRRWEDVLTSKPIGMFDPDSSYNFLFSPVNMLWNHGWVLNAGLREYPYNKIRYGSSVGNSSVSMQVIGRKPYKENGDIPNIDLQKARFVPEEVEFEYPIDDDMIRKIEGITVINGKEIPNLYGLVEFMNDEGVIEKAFVESLKLNDPPKWKLIKSNF